MISRHTLTLAATTALIGSLAMAAPASAKDGFVISGGLNTTTQELNQSRNTMSNQPNVGPAQGASGTVVDKETGLGFSGSIGYKKAFTPDFFAVVEGFYAAEDTEVQIINNVLVNDTELNSTYGVDLRLGTKVNEKVAIYGLASATAFDIDSVITYTFAPPMDAVSTEEWAFVYGGGVDLSLTDRITTFGEFRLADDVSFDTPTDRGGITSRNELNYRIIRTGIRFSF